MVHSVNGLNFEVLQFIPSLGSGSSLSASGSSESETAAEMTYILLVGRGGGNHDAPNLTDTMIVIGINEETESMSLFSLPRDLYVAYPDKK